MHFLPRGVFVTGRSLTELGALMALLVCCFTADLRGQSPPALIFDHLSVDEGLSSSVVLDVYQDRAGFMWFGTDNGLNRYDGYTFQQFSDFDESLRNNSVQDIYEDYRGRIWIATFQGAGFLEPKTGVYHPVVRGVNCNIVRPLGDDRLLLGTGGGLRIVDLKSQAVRSLTTDNGLPTNRIVAIEQDRRGQSWVLFPGGLARFDPLTERLAEYRTVSLPGGGATASWTAFTTDEANNFWLASDQQLIRYATEAARVEQTVAVDPAAEGAASNRTYFVAATPAHGIWLGTDRGLFIYDPVERDLQQHLKGQDQHGIDNNELRCFYADRAGTIWLGTYGGGVNYHSPYNSTFDHFNHELNDAATGNDNIVSGFAEDAAGRLWLTTWGDGLKYYDEASKRHATYPLADGLFSKEVFRSVAATGEDTLWLATNNNGLIRLHPSTGRYHHYQTENSTLGSDNLYTTHFGLGQLWLGLGGGSEGLQRYRPEQDSFTTLPIRLPGTQHAVKYVRVIADDGDRRLFLGTHGQGVLIYDTLSGAVSHYRSFLEGGKLSNGVIYALHYDPRGYLWVGTMAGSINLIHLATGTVIHIGRRHGLPDNCINGILTDREGSLYISTNRGLTQFTPPDYLYSDTVTSAYIDAHLGSDAFVNFVVGDGLQSNEFKYGAYYRAKDGKLYFGGIKGYNRFDPATIVKNPTPPPVAITDIRVFDRDAWPASRSPTIIDTLTDGVALIELEHDQNLLTIDYAALNYSQSNKNLYAYYLENFDNDWRYVGSLRKASYTNLPPGNYTFRVKAANNDGVWNERGAALHINIVPPFWARGYFRILIVAAFASLLYGYYRYRLRQEKRKNRALETAVSERTRELALANDQLKKQSSEIEQMWEKVHDADQQKLRFFTNISHEFRTPLTLIIGPLEDLIRGNKTATKRADTLKIVHKSAVRLLRLINELLDLRSIESGGAQLQVQHLNFAHFLRSIAASFRYQTDLKEIVLRVDLPDHLPLWVDTDKMEKVFFNLLGNALKFTRQGGTIEVTSTVVETEKMLRVTVRNSGKYIPPDLLKVIFDRYVKSPGASSRGSTGLGLSLVKELVEFHHGRVEVSSEEEAGTAFSILIPLGLEPYAASEISERTTFQLEENYELDAGGADAGATPVATAGEVDPDKAIVLIAEDDPDLRAYLRSMFEPACTVVETGDGRTALELTRKFIPDFIISDLMMPELDGLQFCEAVKSDEKTSHIPIIMVTARSFEEDRLRGLALGIDDYITKPFSSTALRLKVENILASRQALRDLLRDVDQIYQVDFANQAETNFYKRLIEAIEANLADEDFNTATLAECMNMSRSQLYRKILAVVNRPASELIREIRMKHAEARLLQTDEQVSTIAYSLGFKNVSHFTKTFTATFGVPPTRFRSRHLETK